MNEDLYARANQQAAMCRLFGNPCRLMIMWSLKAGELAVGEIAEAVGSSLQNVSQHLRLLRKRDLITSRRDGQHIYYRIKDSVWLESCMAMAGVSTDGETTRPPQPIPGGMQ